MIAVQIFFIECLLYILKSSKEAHRFRISFNLELYQDQTSPSMFMTLDRMGVLSATKAHVAPRLPKPILKVFTMFFFFYFFFFSIDILLHIHLKT